MARLYSDEQFPLPVVRHLRKLGHSILTVQDAGKSGQGIPDDEVLAFAIEQRRAVLTLNRYDFAKLHRASAEHFEIIICTNDRDWALFAARINEALFREQSLQRKLIRITRPAR